jgi:hypothetical protein
VHWVTPVHLYGLKLDLLKTWHYYTLYYRIILIPGIFIQVQTFIMAIQSHYVIKYSLSIAEGQGTCVCFRFGPVYVLMVRIAIGNWFDVRSFNTLTEHQANNIFRTFFLFPPTVSYGSHFNPIHNLITSFFNISSKSSHLLIGLWRWFITRSSVCFQGGVNGLQCLVEVINYLSLFQVNIRLVPYVRAGPRFSKPYQFVVHKSFYLSIPCTLCFWKKNKCN